MSGVVTAMSWAKHVSSGVGSEDTYKVALLTFSRARTLQVLRPMPSLTTNCAFRLGLQAGQLVRTIQLHNPRRLERKFIV
eukprot:4741742-Amphidinium_carterae.2